MPLNEARADDGDRLAPATPVPQSPSQRAAQLANTMSARRASSRDKPRPVHGTRHDKAQVARVNEDRLAPRLEAAEAGLRRLDRQADAVREDLAALTHAFHDCSAKVEAQYSQLESAMSIMDSLGLECSGSFVDWRSGLA